jgi:type III secretion system YscQ/HrcQ family protein
VSSASRLVAALAAALVPARAAALLARHPGIDPDESRSLLAAPRAGRLGALAAALRVGARSGVRGTDPWASRPVEDSAGERPAWPVLQPGDVLPFDLPTVAPALTEVDASLIELGARAARSAALGLSSVLGGEAAVHGRLLPGLPEPAGATLVPIELTTLAGIASLAVDCGFASRLAERVAGGAGRKAAAGPLTAAERAVVELAILGALDSLAAETEIEAALGPRLALRGGMPTRPLCVELTISAAGTQGRALLILPEAALRALPRKGEISPALQDVPVRGSFRNGQVALDADELEDLRRGDVLLLDPAVGETSTLQLPGGLAATGRITGDSLEVEEVQLPEDGRSAGTVPVLLEVELATVTLPLRDLARIAPGAVLPLGIDRSGRVTLRVGDRAVAHGELVDVDGGVGVRIGSLVEGP